MKGVGEIILQKIRVGKIIDKIPKNSIVLDLGCGDDYFLLKKIKNRIKEGYGLDEKVLKKDDGNIHLLNFSIKNKIPFPNNFFNVVTALAVFEHLDYPEKIVSEIRRILKKSGKVIMTIPSPTSDFLYRYFLLPFHLVNKESVSQHKYYSKEKLYKFFSLNKFRDIKIETFEFGFNIMLEARK